MLAAKPLTSLVIVNGSGSAIIHTSQMRGLLWRTWQSQG
jgi:hypothetical protein